MSVLVKCNLAEEHTGYLHAIKITIPMIDRLCTISILKQKVAAKVNGLLQLSVGGPCEVSPFHLFWNQTACKIDKELDYFMPLHQPLIFSADIKYKKLQAGEARHRQEREQQLRNVPTYSVAVASLTGESDAVLASASHTISELKTKIAFLFGTPVVQLIYAGKRLEVSQTLGENNIGQGCVVHFVKNFRGGGGGGASGDFQFKFADISHNSSNMEKQAWADSAPAWRRAGRGLCIEGFCNNLTGCEAYSKMVICKLGMGTFDFVLDASAVKCPQCNAHVKPMTCAFNNCEWRFTGIKVGDSLVPEAVKSSEWAVASDQYERFSSKGADRATWSRLLISTRKPESRAFNTECPICTECFQASGSDPGMVTPCGHKYHTSCIEAWRSMGKRTCPVCDRNI